MNNPDWDLLVADAIKEVRPLVLAKVPKEDVADVMQDICLSFWASFPKYRGESKLSTYAYTIAKFRIVDYYRKQSQYKKAIAAAKEIVPPTSNILESDFEWLSRREKDVLRLIGFGLGNDKIAETLFVSRETVRSHVRSIYKLLQCRTRAELVVFSREIFKGEEK